jgi:hypothetical protein
MRTYSRPALAITNNTAYDTGLTVSKVMNRHTLRFGFQHRRYFDNWNAQRNVPVSPTGPLTASGRQRLRRSNAYGMGAFRSGHHQSGRRHRADDARQHFTTTPRSQEISPTPRLR